MTTKQLIIGVYKISNLKSGRYYIGYSTNIEKRFNTHKYKLLNQCHDNIFLQRAYNADGDSNFKFEIIHNCETEEDAKDIELTYLTNMDIRNSLYNLNFNNSGGDLLTHHPDKEAIREKIKAACKVTMEKMTPEERKLKYGQKGEKNGMFGKTHTEEVKKRLSEASKGRPSILKGTHLSEETKKKLSEARKGRFTGKDNPFYGKKHSQETIDKIKKISKGRLPPNTIKIKIDDIEYESITDAARKLNMCAPTILWRLKSKNPRFNNYKYVEPPTNSDNNE